VQELLVQAQALLLARALLLLAQALLLREREPQELALLPQELVQEH
jgi:hypothetical protein